MKIGDGRCLSNKSMDRARSGGLTIIRGHDSIVRIRRSVRPLRPPVPGRRRHIPVHPVGEGLGRFSLNGLEIEGVSGSFAFNGVGVDPVLEVTEIGGHVI
jgi:hypothetical protein